MNTKFNENERKYKWSGRVLGVMDNGRTRDLDIVIEDHKQL